MRHLETVEEGLRQVMANGNTEDIVGYGPGFYLWIISCAIPAVGAWICMAKDKKQTERGKPTKKEKLSRQRSDK